MTVNLPSLDQILTEAAERLEDLTPDLTPAEVDQVVEDCLASTLVTAATPTFAISATMNLALHLEAIHLPVDTARDWAFCEQVGQAAGALLTELRSACHEARSQVLAAIGTFRGSLDA
ncbi:hypothetical protein [Glycomyces niveus]|uniref:Uncharacterized protein n=1 Tax=Glycomyces niveus TaxID=2820287 RepID=A0ABS3U2X6_9ACTN|nr:hypothetical protein [Glycomyces sp. NEAU-S30]MBO3733125.1 hypothetical protein [Glycomyces sp. NEAU-S30]